MEKISNRNVLNIAIYEAEKNLDFSPASYGLEASKEEYIEKLKKMIDALDKKNESAKKSSAKKNAKKDEERLNLRAEIVKILPSGEENAINSSEILAKLGNPDGITISKVSSVLLGGWNSDRVYSVKKKNRVCYYLLTDAEYAAMVEHLEQVKQENLERSRKFYSEHPELLTDEQREELGL